MSVMRAGSIFYVASAVFLICSDLALLNPALNPSLNPSVLAQSTAQEKPKLKDFGSSLKRLKWYPKKQATVEIRQKRETRRDSDEVQEGDVVRVNASLVVSDVLVLDGRGRAVEGLQRDDFIVSEDNQGQQITTFSPGDDSAVPRSIVLIIDYSGSQRPYIKTSVAAAVTLVDQLGSRDRMAIVTDDVSLLSEFTNDKAKLKEKLHSLEKRATGKPARYGHSAQYSALMATLRELFDDEDLRPIVIFQTDGDEIFLLRQMLFKQPILGMFTPCQPREDLEEMLKELEAHRKDFGISDVYAAAEKSRATIYTVIPGRRLIGLPQGEQVKQFRSEMEDHIAAFNLRGEIASCPRKMPEATLWELTEQYLRQQTALAQVAPPTGGWTAFLEKPDQAAQVYGRVLSDINRRYVIGYQPINKERDGKRRKVSVEVKDHPEYTVWGRKSYYAPSPEE